MDLSQNRGSADDAEFSGLQSFCNKWEEPVNWRHTYYQYVSQQKLFYTINGLSEDLGDEQIRNGRSKFRELAVYELLI